MANMREDIVAECIKMIKAQRGVKLGKVVRDPVVPDELPKTAFPAVFVETSNEDIDRITGQQMRSEMELSLVVLIGGESRDTQRNTVISAIEKTLLSDRSLNNKVMDIRLTRVEAISTGESAPFASCRMIFLIEYCYSI